MRAFLRNISITLAKILQKKKMVQSKFRALPIAALILLLHTVSAYPHGKSIYVTCPNSIQSAIDSAHGGDKIVVGPGTYKEQLTISTNGITLVGHDVNIVPPDVAVTNTCSGLVGTDLQAGICIQGSGVVSEPGNPGEHLNVKSVVTYVKDTHVRGFNVTGFTGLNIAVVGAEDTVVTGNVFSSSAQYGVLTVGSKNSHIKHNLILSTTPGPYGFYFIGICMDDKSTVTIAHNDISGYFIGLCVQTSGADIHENSVHEVCVGAYVDPGVNGAKLYDNQFSNSATAFVPCTAPFSAGVVISGATNTVLRSNKFSHIKTTEGKAVGVLLIDDQSGSGAIAAGNDVERNVFSGDNFDIYQNTTGAGNVIKKNQCTSSFPSELCV